MKKIILFILTAVAVLGFGGCARTMNDIISEEPHFDGIVSRFVEDEYIIVDIHSDDYIDGSYSCAVVSLNVKMADSMTHFDEGDEVAVYYDGTYIVEDDKAMVNEVYAVLLLEPADRTKENVS